MIGKNKLSISSEKLKKAAQLMDRFQLSQGEFDDEDPATYLKMDNKRFASNKKDEEEEAPAPLATAPEVAVSNPDLKPDLPPI